MEGKTLSDLVSRGEMFLCNQAEDTGVFASHWDLSRPNPGFPSVCTPMLHDNSHSMQAYHAFQASSISWEFYTEGVPVVSTWSVKD